MSREPQTETIPPERPLEDLKRARLGRRAVLAALVAFLIAAALGAFGVRTGTASARGGGYELTVEYARVTRPGLATPWSVEVTKPGGFDGPITVAVLGDYLDMFDENGLDPEPSRSTADPDFTVWEFDPPSGDTLSVSFDARLEPARQWGTTGIVRLLDGGTPVAEATFKTWVMP